MPPLKCVSLNFYRKTCSARTVINPKRIILILMIYQLRISCLTSQIEDIQLLSKLSSKKRRYTNLKKALRCQNRIIDQYTVNQDCQYFLFPFQTGLDELEDLCDKIEGISKTSFLLNKTKVRKGYIRILIIFKIFVKESHNLKIIPIRIISGIKYRLA